MMYAIDDNTVSEHLTGIPVNQDVPDDSFF